MIKFVAGSLLVVLLKLSISSGGDISCPPWFTPVINATCDSDQPFSACYCSPVAPSRIKCDNEQKTSYLLPGNCAFWNNDSGHTLVSSCPYVFPERLFLNHTLRLPQNVHSLNSYLCHHLSRDQDNIVCGRCTNGTGPAVNSVGSQCVQCHPLNVLYFILLHLLPATIIFVVLLLVQFEVHSTPMAFYILYCSAVSVFLQSPSGLQVYLTLTQTPYKAVFLVVFTLNSLWSFDVLYFLSPPLCLSSHLEDIDKPYIEVVVTLCPFFLLFLAYIGIELHARNFRPVVVLWRPFHRSLLCLNRTWDPHASLVQTFATIFFMSYTKLLFLVTGSVVNADMIDEYGHIEYRAVYIDPRISFGSGKHIYLIVFSLGILLFVILPPIFVLLIYPTKLFIKLQDHLSSRTNLAIKIFVSAFQGSYKDGTNGTRDCRCFPAVLLSACVAIVILSYFLHFFAEAERNPVLIWQAAILLLIILTVVIAIGQPHKSTAVNNTGICLSALLSVAAVVDMYGQIYTLSKGRVTLAIFVFVLVSVPHIVVNSYLVYHVGCKFVSWKLLTGMCCRRGPMDLEQQELLN